MSAERLPVTAAEQVLAQALALQDASLVIFRRGLLVEFKTELLAQGLAVTEEGGHRSWQVGPFEGHHCHLDLAALVQVEFDAEPVSCQQGRLNYTVWFLAAGDCGNPYRPRGAFSVTLNAPYGEDGQPRQTLIDAVYALHDRCAALPGVGASPAFERCRPATAVRGPIACTDATHRQHPSAEAGCRA